MLRRLTNCRLLLLLLLIQPSETEKFFLGIL